MASFDWKRSSHAHGAPDAAEDPLVELARIVSADDGYFRRATDPYADLHAADAAFASDLEADLLAEFDQEFAAGARDVLAAGAHDVEFGTNDLDPAASGLPAAYAPITALPQAIGLRGQIDDLPLQQDPAGEAPATFEPDLDDLFASAIASGRIGDPSRPAVEGEGTFGPVPPVLSDAPRAAGGRAGLSRQMLAAAVSIVAVMAGGAAYLSTGSGIAVPSGPVPVIEADSKPFKVREAAPKAVASNQTGQAVFDRVAGRAPTPDETLVDRSEEPQTIDISQTVDAEGDEPIMASISEETAEPIARPPAEPMVAHRVQTVRIGPADAPAPAAEAVGEDAADAAPATRALDFAEAPDSEPAIAEAVPAAAPKPRPAVRERAVAEEPITPPPADEIITAAVAPAPEPAIPVAAPSGASGGFAVQLSSQKTEAQARSAYANLQKKFPSILGGHDASIAKADLGAKGVYYRVRVGSLASRSDAAELCQKLKSAGASCFVTR